MRACITLPALMLIVFPLRLCAQGGEQLAATLAALPAYQAQAQFEVLLPNAQEPVIYAIDLQSQLPADPDSLSPCDYYINWSTGATSGFSAYFAGDHYRYRNNRLQEYHAQESINPFMPTGLGSQAKGVQQCAQFADLLPQFIGSRLLQMLTDTTYAVTFHADTIISGQRRIAVDGSRYNQGYEISQFLYVFDPATGLPLSSSIVNSPGAISEQIVDVTYHSPQLAPISLTEQGLIDAWPDAFERFRESNFRVESIVGVDMPAYSALDGQGERLTHHLGEAYKSPTVIVAINPQVSTAAETIAAVRKAAELLPPGIEIIWAMADNDANTASHIIGELRPGEQLLLSAKSLMRNCGINLFPTMIFLKQSGQVADVYSGYNKDLAEIVIEKVIMLD